MTTFQEGTFWQIYTLLYNIMIYFQDMVSRLLLSLAFDCCEAEGDAEGLRALRRVMVCYFLANKPHRLDSKYASFTLIDLVVELSESERTRKHMDLYVVINPSGSRGGGLFRDKHEEQLSDQGNPIQIFWRRKLY